MKRWLAAAAVLATSLPACANRGSFAPSCIASDSPLLTLMAQAVPSATQLPCVGSFPVGWTYGGSDVRSGFARFWLDSDRAGIRAVEIDLSASCDTTGATPVTPTAGETHMRVYERQDGAPPGRVRERYFVFTGGCVTYRYGTGTIGTALLVGEANLALAFYPRSLLVARIRNEVDLTLCGAGAPPCPG